MIVSNSDPDQDGSRGAGHGEQGGHGEGGGHAQRREGDFQEEQEQDAHNGRGEIKCSINWKYSAYRIL